MKGFSTRAVHGGQQKKDAHNALRMPVYDSVAFGYDTALEIQHAFEGKKASHSYTRISNPTVEDFEQKVKAVFGGQGVIAVSSGMAAIANVLMAVCEAGTNIVTTKYLFGNTYSLLETTLKTWGLEVQYVNLTDATAVKNAINDKTRMVFLESITNPQLEIVDIKSLSRITKGKGIPLVLE